MCLFVSLSVSVGHKSVFSQSNEGINLVFGMEAFFNSPTLGFKEIQVSTKIGIFPSGTFPNLRKFCHGISLSNVL